MIYDPTGKIYTGEWVLTSTLVNKSGQLFSPIDLRTQKNSKGLGAKLEANNPLLKIEVNGGKRRFM